MTPKSKINIAIALLILFAVLFLATIEDPAVRRVLPFAAVLIFGYLIYCAFTLLRPGTRLEDDPPVVGKVNGQQTKKAGKVETH